MPEIIYPNDDIMQLLRLFKKIRKQGMKWESDTETREELLEDFFYVSFLSDL